MTVHRRTVLAALGTAVATAGCFGSGGPGEGGSSADGTPPDSPGTTPGETHTDAPERPFADVPCPSFTETDRTICWHTRDEDAPLVIEPERVEFQTVRGNDTVETLRLTLANRSERHFGLNPYAWGVYRRDNGEWRRVAPDGWIEPWETVEPGETYDWVLAAEEHPTPSEDDTVHAVADLDSATHAFAVHGQLGTDSEGDGESTSVECVALFDVVVAVQDSWPTDTGDA